ncbi:hypothetical protein GUJ93_ZPchr0001g31364 [Zizania palustris]|uniref:Ataxin-2 C-terminal domain-containing protein n=1 Tax=Zizania palustris TaxID=103762 RepID=A0A8J5S9L9_ZIZPA|nr:hypothetical protein GUJ93_ZPchr0001g31364 [Zizania palustris]
MAAVAGGSAAAAPAASAAAAVAAAAKEVEYQTGVQKLVDLLSKLNPAAKEFIPSSAAASSPSNKGLSADAPVFDYYPVGGANEGGKDAGADTYQQRRKRNGYINQGRRRMMNERARHAEREDSIRRTVYVSDIDHTVTEERLADIFATCGQVQNLEKYI